MPLPEGLTSDPNPSVGRDEFGNMMVVTSDGLAATFKEGTWQAGFLFPARSWFHDFSDVSDPHEAEHILDQASDALRKFKAAHAGSFND